MHVMVVTAEERLRITKAYDDGIGGWKCGGDGANGSVDGAVNNSCIEQHPSMLAVIETRDDPLLLMLASTVELLLNQAEHLIGRATP